jgi:peptidoglycan/xylan/chitin deacetylase (PgdA/CDA1 family)
MKKNLLITIILNGLLYPTWAYENIKTKTDNVALTFDACDGKTDTRILKLIKEEKIPVTLFVTGKWLDKNPESINFIKENKQFFKIENHGLNHLEAVESERGAYHLKTVKNEEGLIKEVLENQKKIEAIFGVKSVYYRTAGALYDEKSIQWIKKQNLKIGGYTISADEGAKASKEKIIKNLSKVKNGDVILMHINHPNSQVYEGFKEGLKIMQEKNLKFEFLKD